jgi:GT2 family glycosyltransferase
MKVSIIIPTYNRNEMLCKTIANILLFEHQYHELIIVDQTKEHETQTRLYLDNLVSGKKIKYLYVDYPNLPNARNVGIQAASGDIILFFDDDVEINKDTIPSHVSGFSLADVGCVTGKVIVQNTKQDGNKVLENTGILKKRLKKLLFLFLKKRASYVGRLGILANYSGDKTLPADSCIGCNMSFKKEAFIKCGLFDSNFTGNAVREDTDMSVRLRRSGYKIMYIPQAAIVHYMDNTGGTRVAASEEYWHTIFRNQCYFYLKNFHYSRMYIMFLQIFDLLRCRKSGKNACAIFRQSYDDASGLLIC